MASGRDQIRRGETFERAQRQAMRLFQRGLFLDAHQVESIA